MGSNRFSSRVKLCISFWLGVVFAVLPSAVIAQPGKGNVTGLPPEALERLPAAAKLFQVGNASATPRILDHPYVEGEIVARFPLELGDGQVDQLARSLGAHGVERASPLGLFLIRGPRSRQGMEKLMERLWESGEAVDLAPNYIGQLTFVPDDPHHVSGAQWYHEAPSDIDLDLRSAWDITRGSEDVVVAVIDTGIVEHPEFAGRLFVNPGEIPGNKIDDDGNGFVDDVSGWNAVPPRNNNTTDTTIGHGTWVASILMTNSFNSRQVAGMDHFAKLLPVKFADSDRPGTLDLVAALDYLIANPGMADIVNMSLANLDTLLVFNALSALSETSILIGGSGNRGEPNGADSGLPESHPAVITVAGTDRFDNQAVFSTGGSDGGIQVDFAAPATEIFTASWVSPDDPNAAHMGEGTSFSSPMVAGIATLGLSIRPSMTKSDLLAALRESAEDLGPAGRDPMFGWGRVNAYDALRAFQTMLFTDDFESGDLTAWSSSSP